MSFLSATDHWSPLGRAMPTLQGDNTFLRKLFPSISLEITTGSSLSVRTPRERGVISGMCHLRSSRTGWQLPRALGHGGVEVTPCQVTRHCSHTHTHTGRTQAQNARENRTLPPPGLESGAGTQGELKAQPEARGGSFRIPRQPLAQNSSTFSKKPHEEPSLLLLLPLKEGIS